MSEKFSIPQNYTRVSMPIRAWMELKDANRINTDAAFQRPDNASWQKPAKVSLLIDSVLSGFPLPEIFIAVIDTRDGSQVLDIDPESLEFYIYVVIDGKQRTGALSRYYNNVLALDGESLTDSLQNLSGKSFNDLPKDVTTAFLDSPLQFCIVRLSDDQISEFFTRLNSQGVRLTPKQATRGKYSSKLAFFKPAIDHSFWGMIRTGKVGDLSISGIESIVMNVIAWYNAIPSQESVPVINFWLDYAPDQKDLDRLTTALDIMAGNLPAADDTARKIYKRALKSSHITVLLSVITESTIDIFDLVYDFFETASKDRGELQQKYFAAGTDNANSAVNVGTRMSIMTQVITGTKPVKTVTNVITSPNAGLKNLTSERQKVLTHASLTFGNDDSKYAVYESQVRLATTLEALASIEASLKEIDGFRSKTAAIANAPTITRNSRRH
jgi:hypothetical protein